MNHPYQNDPRPIVGPRDAAYTEREYHGGCDRWAECDVCRRPLYQDAWVGVEVRGEAETRLLGQRFCSDRCLSRAVLRLPEDDNEAITRLTTRLDNSESDYRDERRRAEGLEGQIEGIKRCWAQVVEAYPTMKDGGRAPAGGQLRRLVEQFERALNASPKPPDRRR